MIEFVIVAVWVVVLSVIQLLFNRRGGKPTTIAKPLTEEIAELEADCSRPLWEIVSEAESKAVKEHAIANQPIYINGKKSLNYLIQKHLYGSRADVKLSRGEQVIKWKPLKHYSKSRYVW